MTYHLGTGNVYIDSGRVLTRERLDEITEKIFSYDASISFVERTKDIFHKISDYIINK